jgi:cytoskeleton protein RodZ
MGRFQFMARGNFGERLKREREMREVSVNEVTTATRIGPRFLEALENEDWEKLPGGVFNRGFVRAIARFLGLDEESLLAEYDLARGEQKIEAPAPYENRIPGTPKWILALGTAAIIAILVALFYSGQYGWRRYAAHRASQHNFTASPATAPQAATRPGAAISPGAGVVASTTARADSARTLSERSRSASGATPSAPETRTPAGALDLSVATSAATRVRVLGDGQLLLDGDVFPGDTHHFSAARQFDVMAADSGAVLLELNGQAMPPLGAPGAAGTMRLTEKDLRLTQRGTSQP